MNHLKNFIILRTLPLEVITLNYLLIECDFYQLVSIEHCYWVLIYHFLILTPLIISLLHHYINYIFANI